LLNQEIAAEKKQAILQVISQIPTGKIATYGQIASLAGFPGAARLVGSTLKNLPKTTKLPWHRVINAQLKISKRSSHSMRDQKQKLSAEGIQFNNSRILREHLWHL
jgi:methylated-DNA-protein-cysteine methyltransferase-like protein